MPKNQVIDPITDKEIAFAHLILSGTMTDRRAAEAAGLNPGTAAYTKAKPSVRAYMLEHQATVHERLVDQETEELRRLNQAREQVLARLWKSPTWTPKRRETCSRSDEGPLHDRRHRRPDPFWKQSSPPLLCPEHRPWRRLAWRAANEYRRPRSHARRCGTPDFGSWSCFDFVPSEPAPPSPQARAASAPDNRVPSSIEKKPDTLRLRL